MGRGTSAALTSAVAGETGKHCVMRLYFVNFFLTY